MGYHSKVKGFIKFSPGISVDEVRNHPVLSKFEETPDQYPDLQFFTHRGNLLDSIKCPNEEGFKAYYVEDDLKEIVTNLPDRTFTGRLEIYGEDDGDVWGLRVKNGVVEQLEPKLVWPED